MIMSIRSVMHKLLPRKVREAMLRAYGPVVLDSWAMERLPREFFFDRAFRALSYNKIDGDYAEFGCHGGTTFCLAYHAARRYRHPARLWGFDSFAGLPAPQQEDKHPRWREGKMRTSVGQFHRLCKVNGIPLREYEIVPGYFDQTLKRVAPQDPPVNLCMAYVDCDLYSSTKTVLEFLVPRIKHGMIIAFDDYYCWSASTISGERRAMLELFENHERWSLLPYIQYAWGGVSFVVEDKGLRP